MISPQTYLTLCCEKYKSKNNENCNEELELFEKTDYSSFCHKNIQESLSCCLLYPIDYDIDIITNNLVPIYKFKKDQQLTRDFDIIGNRTDLDLSQLELDLNYSILNFPNDIWNTRASWEICVKTIALIPIVLIAILGNLTVIRIVMKKKVFRKNPINLFILNLSIADLTFALLFPWIFLISDFYQTFVLGELICRSEGFVLVTLMLTSVFTLTVISFDRLIAIVFPYNVRMQPKVAKWIIISIWIIAFGISTPLIVWRSYKERVWKDFYETWCTEDIQRLKSYWLVLIILLVWIPLAILTICYTAIVVKVKLFFYNLGLYTVRVLGTLKEFPRLHKLLCWNSNFFRVASTRTLETLEKRQRDQPITKIKHKFKVIRMLFLVVLAFSICWIPFTALIIIRNYNASTNGTVEVREWYQILYFVSHYLMFVNSAINPIIYGLKNDNFKREMRLYGLPACFKKQNKLEVSTVLGNGRIGIVDQRKHMEKTKGQKLAAKYGVTISSTPSTIPSLSSFDRRNSALLDLGLPIPNLPSSSDSLKLNYAIFKKSNI